MVQYLFTFRGCTAIMRKHIIYPFTPIFSYTLQISIDNSVISFLDFKNQMVAYLSYRFDLIFVFITFLSNVA